MSRRDEVTDKLRSILERDVGYIKAWTDAYDLAHTLADEVDELRKAGIGFRDRCKAVSLEYTKVCTENDHIAAERDRLATENAELWKEVTTARFNLKRKQSPNEHLFTEPRDAELATLNATLDRLREVFLRLCKGNETSEAIDDMDAILYPPETNHDHK